MKDKKSNIAVRYRIYPNAEQKEFFSKTFGCCRKVWNLMKTDKDTAYKERKETIHPTPAQYKKEYSYLKDVDSLALANVQLNLNKAYNDFFKACKSKKKFRGFPKYKSAKKSRRSYTTNNQGGTIYGGEDFIRLPKAGNVKAVIHRCADENWKLKSATISQDKDGAYYCSVLYEYERNIKTATLDVESTIGLDYKSDGLYVDSNGKKPPLHKYYRQSQKKLGKLQRRLSRKTGSRKGEKKSNNYWKQLKRVNKLHAHIANQRKDFLHKLSTEIANQYDVVCVENLNMRAMSNKGFGNGKATLYNGYGMFLDMLEYKLENRGKHLVKVDKFFPSSQLCYKCGEIHSEMKDLSKRYFRCSCSYENDRDINAARNIKQEGLRLLGLV